MSYLLLFEGWRDARRLPRDALARHMPRFYAGAMKHRRDMPLSKISAGLVAGSRSTGKFITPGISGRFGEGIPMLFRSPAYRACLARERATHGRFIFGEYVIAAAIDIAMFHA